MPNRNSLKINDGSQCQSMPLIQAINSNSYNLLNARSSVFLIQPSVKRVSKASNRYYNVRLVHAKHGHYVEYHHRIPTDLLEKLPPEYIKKEWLDKKTGKLLQWARFRHKGLLNTVAPEDYEETAATLVHSVKLLLQNGYDPFKVLTGEYKEEALQLTPVMQITKDTSPIVTFREAVDKWLKKYPPESESRKSYNVIKNLLEGYFGLRFDENVRKITAVDLEDMLIDEKEENEWTKSTYNDKVKKLRTCFGWMADKKRKIIPENIASSVDLLTKVAKIRHTYYDNEKAEKLRIALLNHEDQPYGRFVYYFCNAIYFTTSRPGKETRQLKCENILWDRKQIYFPPEISKGGQGGHIPLDPEFAALLKEMGVDKAPGKWYIFGRDYKPGPQAIYYQSIAWFFRMKVRPAIGLGQEYTLYSFKHTRVIHLYKSGVKPAAIQQRCRHKSPTEFEEYLRDLGVSMAEDLSDFLDFKQWKF